MLLEDQDTMSIEPLELQRLSAAIERGDCAAARDHLNALVFEEPELVELVERGRFSREARLPVSLLPPIYEGDFANWSEVRDQFAMDDPEPDQVIYATYDIDHYEGSADVLYRNGNQYFYVSGSHCSCHGLEGQWAPEEMSRESLLGTVDRATYGFFKDKAAIIRASVGALN